MVRIIELEKILNKKYCLLTKNGCSALYILLKILDLKKKYIILPANVCAEVVVTIVLSGNNPLLVDIDRNFTLSYSELLKVKSQNVGAILYPYMYGNIGEVIKIKSYALKKGWFFIEDIAPALGAKVKQKVYAGSISDYSICSYGVGKILDLGTGGSLNVNSGELYTKALKENKKLKKFNKNFIYKRNKLNNIIIKVLNKDISKNELSKKKLIYYKNSLISKFIFSKKYINNLNLNIKKIDSITQDLVNKSKIFSKYLKNKNISVISHQTGATYWRKNIMVYRKKKQLLSYLKINNIYARDYFYSLNCLFPFYKKYTFKNAERFYKHIINFWPGKKTKLIEVKKINLLVKKFYNN